MKSFHLHLVSDATGETLSSVARACLVLFEGHHAVQHLWWLVRTPGQASRVIEGIEANPGIVLFTIVDPAVRNLLEDACRRLMVPCIPVLDPVLFALSNYLNAPFHALPGRQHEMDAEYFRRIDAMHFTLAHDDGQLIEDFDEADVILVGVSRTSKTPTAMYLANRGLKAANYPLVPGVPLPQEILDAKKPLIVGLTKDPRSLTDIRRNRLAFLNQDTESDYADYEKVREEVNQARKLYTRYNWPVIDVTRRSIEEASAAILQLYIRRNGSGGRD
ncbi:pyruvate, water dikinase regulatory protein [Telmatospirillum sp. J64-1]|uniref:pyruvate, water dikinase regulatory protein n=1 Tax=Telmatospirillum sp. J64-1 TaxID=2502183 RepID=UPI00115D1E83|nr:pyruvate, water dikinase regulatory protein [Telmatospirillum sp. J64-1]